MAGVKQSGSAKANVAAIVAHPLRARCLTHLAERTASPSEMKLALGVPLGDVAYHVKRLCELGAVELVETRQVRGAIEHFYRANLQPFYSDEEAATLTVDERQRFAEQVCMLAFADATRAVEERTFCARPDYYATRVPLKVDEEGWRELNQAYRELLERIMEIKAASAERTAADADADEIRTSALAMFFEMPEPRRGR